MTRASRNASAPHHQRPPAPVTVGYVRTVIAQSPVPQINTLIQAGVAEAGIYLERAATRPAGPYATSCWPDSTAATP